MKKFTSLLAASFAAVLLAASAKAADIPYVGFQFSVGGTGLNAGTLAGVASQAHFNVNGNQSGTFTGLVNASGGATNVNLAYTADNSYGSGATAAGPNGTTGPGPQAGDAVLLSGEDKSYGTPTNILATYSLTNVPNGNYDLILYTVNDASGALQQTTITTGTTATSTLYSVEQNGTIWNGSPTYKNGASATTSGATSGNYIEFFNIHPASGTIAWEHMNTGLGGGNGTVSYNGFQLTIATPEPSSFILCGIAAVGLLVAARRRRKA